MGLLIWLAISFVCLIVFIVVNRWVKWVEAWGDTSFERFMICLMCLLWPLGLILFTCMLGAKLIERFLP